MVHLAINPYLNTEPVRNHVPLYVVKDIGAIFVAYNLSAVSERDVMMLWK